MKKTGFKTMDFVWLIVALSITVVYIVFSSPFYVYLYPDGEFANEMYNNDLYLVVASYVSLLVWFVAILYYWIIDRFDKLWIWLLSILIVVVLSPMVGIIYCGDYFKAENMDSLLIPLKNFNIINTLVTVVFYIIVTLCIKPLSVNCRTTPF